MLHHDIGKNNVNRFIQFFFHQKIPKNYDINNFHLTWSVLLHYLVKVERSKMLPI